MQFQTVGRGRALLSLFICIVGGCGGGGGGGAPPVSQAATVTGTVITPTGRPISGLTVRVVDSQLAVRSDTAGHFRIDALPFAKNGNGAIEFDASTGVPTSTFRMRMPLQANGRSAVHLPDPIVIPIAQEGAGTRIHAATSQVAGAPSHPGAGLMIAAGSVDFAATDGRTTTNPLRQGEISLVYMPRHQLPGPMPGGQMSDVVFSIQPSGIAFDPPAPITFPNYDRFAPNTQVPIMQVDPQLGDWVQVGTATVNAAGTLIVSDPGSGAKWGSCTGCCFPPCRGNVVGRVTLRSTTGAPRPLANATVRISTGQATTDADGRYRMDGVAVGNCATGNGPFEQQAVATYDPENNPQPPLRVERTVALSPNTENTVDFEFDVVHLSFVDDHNDRQGVLENQVPTSATITAVVADNERDGSGSRHGTHVQVLPVVGHALGDDAVITIAIDPSSDPGDRGSLLVDQTVGDGRAGTGSVLEERQSVEVGMRELRNRSKMIRYLAPAVFLPGEIDSTDGREVRRIRLSATVRQTTQNGSETFGTFEPVELRIVRPQLFFVHGTLSSRGAWTNDGNVCPDATQLTTAFLAAFEHVIGRGDRDLYERVTADYSQAHQRPIAELAPLVLDQLERYRQALQREGIAATRFDVVAHSYGGLIVREIIQLQAEATDKAQRVRRLGTLGAPHLGASLADRILNLCDQSVPGGRRVLLETVDAVNKYLAAADYVADLCQWNLPGASTTALQVEAAVQRTYNNPAYGNSIFTDAANQRRMLEPLRTRGLAANVRYVFGYGTRRPTFSATDSLYALFGYAAGSVESYGDLFIAEGSARAGARLPISEVHCPDRQHSNLTLLDCIEALVGRLQATSLTTQVPEPVPARRGPVIYWVSHAELDPTQPYELRIVGENLFTTIENGLRVRLPTIQFIVVQGITLPVFAYRWVSVPRSHRSATMVRFSSVDNPLPSLPLGSFYTPGRIQIDVDGEFTNEVYIALGTRPAAPAIDLIAANAAGDQFELLVDHELGELHEPQLTVGSMPATILSQTTVPAGPRFRTRLVAAMPPVSGQVTVELREGLGPYSNILRLTIAAQATSLAPALTCVGMPVTVSGARFGRDPTRIVARIGGVVQPVVAASGNQMVFLVQDGTRTGPVQITVDGIAALGSAVLTVAPDDDRDGMPDDWERTHGLAVDDPADALRDADTDGLDNRTEYRLRTDPRRADTDSGGLADGSEVALRLDPLDPADDTGDPDGDNLPTPLERTLGTDPTRADTDADRLNDGQEHFGNLGFVTSPLDADTDDDGLTDGDEVLLHRTNPLVADHDGDGINDGDEIAGTLGEASNPLLRDSDGDGLDDRDELVTHGTSPTRTDTDGDGLSDGDEIRQHLTDPRLADTDGDTLDDGLEIALGLDPRAATSVTTVIGTVQMPDGLPAAGAEVVLDGVQHPAYVTTTNATGAFRITRCPAVAISPPGIRSISVTASIQRTGSAGCFGARSVARSAVVGGNTDVGLVRLTVAADQPLFPITAATPSLSVPFQVLPVDVDADGSQDLLTLGNSPNLSLLPGRGCGLFGTERLLPLGSGQSATGPMIVADLEGDGLPEILVPEPLGITMYANRRTPPAGRPTLGTATLFALPVQTNTVVAVDIDLDRDLDPVALSGSNRSLVVLRNDGGLSLTPRPLQALSFTPGLPVTGDFDRDGGVDLAVAEYLTGTVHILGNGGDGTFVVRTTLSVGGRASRIRAADLDANGELDLVCHDNQGDTLALFLNRGGAFTRTVLAVPGATFDFDVADLDGDRDLDLLLADFDNALHLLRNNGLGGFAQPVALPLSEMPTLLALTDVDGDGNVDAVVGSYLSTYPTYVQLLGVHRGLGNGILESDRLYEHDTLSPWRPRIAVGDVNGDGRPDLVVARNDLVELRQGTVNGQFGPIVQVHDGQWTGVRIALADLDNVNGADIVVADTVGNLVRLLNQGNSAFGAPATRSSSDVIEDLVMLDVDRDGLTDALTCGISGVRFWRNQGGSFAAPVVVAGTAGFAIDDLLAADLDGDGWLDAAALEPGAGRLHLLRNLPTGLAVQPAMAVRSDLTLREDRMVAADLDDDGRPDLAVVSDDPLTTPRAVVQMLANLGGFQFGTAVQIAIEVPFAEVLFGSIAAADFNRDNRTDLAIAGRSGVLLLERNGPFTFATREHVRASGRTQDVIATDVDADQRTDLVISVQDRLSSIDEWIQVMLQRR